MVLTGDLHRWIAWLFHTRGSDLILTEGVAPTVRVDGKIMAVGNEAALDVSRLRGLVAELLTPEQLTAFHRELELDFTMAWEGGARLRGNVFMQRGAPAVALRAIPVEIPTFDQIGLPQAVRDLVRLPQGLVLFTGPTGVGKSTTQAAMIEWINANRQCHIITIEDPIEYMHDHKRSVISQREIGTDTHSFQRALRASLREDPDVLLVGEMRDAESIAIALTLAETGHLVLSTLHTNDSSQALDRIVDVFPGDQHPMVRSQLASTLAAVVAQRLVPRRGGGLVAAFEVLIGTHAVRNLIREGKTRQLRNIISTSQAAGMQTLETSLSSLVAEGVVDYEDAVAQALHPNEVTKPSPPSAVPTQVA
jgi:twitching motility protein PilT